MAEVSAATEIDTEALAKREAIADPDSDPEVEATDLGEVKYIEFEAERGI